MLYVIMYCCKKHGLMPVQAVTNVNKFQAVYYEEELQELKDRKEV